MDFLEHDDLEALLQHQETLALQQQERDRWLLECAHAHKRKMASERRDRIATAVLAGLCAHASDGPIVRQAVVLADELIVALDERRPDT